MIKRISINSLKIISLQSVWQQVTVADQGGARGHTQIISLGQNPPDPVKITHKKDGYQRQPHRFHVSHPTRPLDPLPSHNVSNGLAKTYVQINSGTSALQKS